MIFELLNKLPRLPISIEAALLLSVLLVSLGAALVALIRNRRVLSAPTDDDSDMGAIFENPSSILPHVIELRNRLILGLIGIVIGTVAAAALTEQILHLLAEPIGGLGAVQAIRVTENVSVFFRIAITAGIILASPYVIAQLWIFIAAGLKQNERRTLYLLFPFALILFLSGVAFSYLVMLPVAVPFLTTFMGISTMPTLDDYIKFMTTVMLWVGVSFELPLVIFGLAKMGVVNTRMLIQNWRIALILIAILSAVVTPTPDPVNMGIVAAPLMVLYLLSIVLSLFA
jgi:sec-independent protein translocase protein TatC